MSAIRAPAARRVPVPAATWAWLARKPATSTADGEYMRQPPPATSTADGEYMRQPPPASSTADGEYVRQPPPVVDEVLATPGQPLDGGARAVMEPRFGHDFSRVRVHADAAAARSARAVDAHAFTVGDHIVFGEGRLALARPDGLRLLAHELAHVVQQPGLLARQPDRKRTDAEFDDLARSLTRKLLTGKRADVLRDLQAMQPQELTSLESATWKVLQPDDGEPLRRVIDFVRVPSPSNQSVVTVAPKSGVEATKAGARVAAGSVSVQTGLTADAGAAGKSTSAYALTYSGSDAREMRWLQFAWREVVPEFAV